MDILRGVFIMSSKYFSGMGCFVVCNCFCVVFFMLIFFSILKSWDFLGVISGHSMISTHPHNPPRSTLTIPFASPLNNHQIKNNE